ncbi:MAG: CorA family divalent cation transporter, partial [Sphingobium sp.]
MTIIAAVHYEKGEPSATIDLHDASGPPTSGFDWLGLFEPSEEEMAAVAKRYGLHPLAVEDAISGRQLPKIESYGEQLFLVARTASLID